VNRSKALDYVVGYTVFNDVTAAGIRDTEEKLVTPTLSLSYSGRYKNYDTFGPMGPCIVTKDELPDPDNLKITGKINGRLVQEGRTSDYLFSVAELIEWMSHVQTLPVGTVICCGTVKFSAPQKERDCDFNKYPDGVCEGEIEGVGVLKNKIRIRDFPVPTYSGKSGNRLN
jgi:2-keto-4-pentenoate hydratase/2-oxohepta-3-ene-1,7-dioic acid hydratase in catechol pathway